jgi:hypothetical protein
VRVHGKGKHRVWRKLHLAVDTTTGEIVAHALTPSKIHEATELEGLLAEVEGPIAAVYGDGAYDAFDIHAGARRAAGDPAAQGCHSSPVRRHHQLAARRAS